MAPVKFEEHIKNKLEQRAIKPSETAWNTLAEKLDAQDKKKSNTTYLWFGVAASIVIVIMVSNSIFNKSMLPDENKAIQVVTSEDKNQQNKEEIIDNNPIVEDVIVAEIEEPTVIEAKKTEQSNISHQQKVAEVKTTTNQNTKDLEYNRIAFNTDYKTKNEIKESERITSENAFVQVDIKSKTDSSENLDSEIEALLSKAQKDVSTKTAISKEKSKINPEGLLEEVEFDLDQSFRDKVFQKLKTSYKKVSTAVAHRND